MSSILERDAGFYSGSSEIGDDSQSERLNSNTPTDSSDDSIEIKLQPISLPKRKTRLAHESDIPLKKRIKFDSVFSSQWPERATDDTSLRSQPGGDAAGSAVTNVAEILVRHPGVTTLHRIPDAAQDQPLELTTKKSAGEPSRDAPQRTAEANKSPKSDEPTMECDENTASSETCPSGTRSRPSHQRNYKSMTRERRIEANARERTRVHTISAAFDTLRTAIPSYSSTQKMSKLSVLRVACSYILALSRMAGEDYSEAQNEPSVAECLEEVTRTVQIEGKVRKRKDE